MTKPSLDRYCRIRGISINKRFGLSYSSGEVVDRDREMQTNFMDLSETLEAMLS